MQPLQGITVIDVTHVMAGPFCTHLLRLLGARVIKIERPGEGDVMRHYERDPEYAHMAPPFMAFNAGKESLTLDLKSSEGARVVRKLAAKSDVVVENFRPGVMARLGLGYDDLSRLNDRLIYCAVSGFGQAGPLRDNPAYDHIVQGVCGVMTLTGAPGSPPTKVGFPMVDTFTGYSAAFAILSAVLQRTRTDKGQCVDVAMLDAALVLMSAMVVPCLTTGVEPRKVGNRGFNDSPTSDTFTTSDASITLGANTQRQFEQLCEVIGAPETKTDPRFITVEARIANVATLRALIEAKLRTRTAREWEGLLNAAGVPAGAVRTIPEVLAEPHLASRGLVMPLTPSAAGHTGFGLNIGFKLADGGLTQMGAPPMLGEHTRLILTELGYTDLQIDELKRTNVV
jgi:crotonobetainyl-CoA:carnitine CoA-transferase CaiB-like acyl-CoA transferase